MDVNKQQEQTAPETVSHLVLQMIAVNAVFFVIDLLILALLGVTTNSGVIALINGRSLSILLFAESGAVFVIAGALALSYSVSWTRLREYVYHTKEKVSTERFREGEKRANPYLIIAILLFAESFAVSFLLP